MSDIFGKEWEWHHPSSYYIIQTKCPRAIAHGETSSGLGSDSLCALVRPDKETTLSRAAVSIIASQVNLSRTCANQQFTFFQFVFGISENWLKPKNIYLNFFILSMPHMGWAHSHWLSWSGNASQTPKSKRSDCKLMEYWKKRKKANTYHDGINSFSSGL